MYKVLVLIFRGQFLDVLPRILNQIQLHVIRGRSPTSGRAPSCLEVPPWPAFPCVQENWGAGLGPQVESMPRGQWRL